MPIVFAGNAGRVAVITDKVAVGAISLGNVYADAAAGDFGPPQGLPQKVIITGIGLNAAGNLQFAHSIGNDIHVYVFGDRMGQVQVHGLCFAQTSCGGGGSETHGFENLYQWYATNRIAARKSTVTTILGTRTGFEGFLIDLWGNVEDAMTRTIEFKMTIAVLPDAE